MISELFPRVNIGQVDFNGRQANSCKRIPDRKRIVRIGSGIDHNPVGPMSRILDRINQGSFTVGLENAQLRPVFLGKLSHLRIDIIQSQGSVHFRFPLAEHVQIRSMNEQHFEHGLSSLRCFYPKLIWILPAAPVPASFSASWIPSSL